MKKPTTTTSTPQSSESSTNVMNRQQASSTTPPLVQDQAKQSQTESGNNEELSSEFLKQYDRLQQEGKEINPEELKIQNVMKETLSNPKTFHAARTQFARATGIGYSLLGGGVALGLLIGFLFKRSNQKQQ
ncbi:hypothetical protein FDP41_004000 [Naegleria fowleri]|uniref:Uncharacterized protein n=1 Tax=Naegleria fowleri TaxID=5763 RepID=A0A6A5BTH9_NAEFO|nr:uncharacterized protein FDP41_004000 [Naegleria fowleri]KAF0976705.1 hypothetical protein FDP41_004000 [Naegleria fowleri]CAG4714431.1 unnamed protein product [Naegleria fowleri]